MKNERSLQLDGVGIRIGARTLVAGLDLVVRPGAITTVMGPSGSGKSSLLAYICGTLDPAIEGFGRVSVDGRDVTALPPERRHIGILFQDDLLFPHMSVGQNLAFGVPQALPRSERAVRVAAALEVADLADFADRYPASLSGGQRARIALLRTLLSEPAALLLDEPFGKLDTELRSRFRRWVFAESLRRQLPTLLVTHDPEDAAAAGGPILSLL
jgi:putative thiamine transport system ATP-binding protein